MINGAIMYIKQLSLVAAVSALIFTTATNAVLGPIPIYLKPVDVSSNHFNGLDTEATFASEIYTADDIKKSNSSSIYDFFNNNTSITFTQSSGNVFAQKADMRGFGIYNGYQNIVITLNGRRLNNINMSSQSLSGIILDNIEKIEITKGSGSVVYGDGAMAGSIHIYTKHSEENSASYTIGTNGIKDQSISVSSQGDNTQISVSLNKYSHDGFSDADHAGFRDRASKTNKHIQISQNLNKSTDISLTFSESDTDNRYPQSQTLDEFNLNPATNSGMGAICNPGALWGDPCDKVYGHGIENQKIYVVSIDHDLNNNSSISFKTSKEKKSRSEKVYYKTSADLHDFDIITYNLKHNYTDNNISIDTGYDVYNGEKVTNGTPSSKDNSGYFIQARTLEGDITYSAGLRNEKVKYKFNNDSGFNKSYSLNAFDLGLNKKVNNETSVFFNYNKGFQAVDLNRSYEIIMSGSYDETFKNDVIDPAKIKTLTIGVNHLTENSKTKASLYRSNLTNEIFYDSSVFSIAANTTGHNANIDKSHHQGVEIQNQYRYNPKTSTTVNYTYTDAIIDQEQTFAGNTIPGVSKHSISTSVKYTIDKDTTLGLGYKYRSGTYNSEDFANTSSTKQMAYKSTNLNYSKKLKKDLDLNINVDNLFANKNGTVVDAWSTYADNFTRKIKAGLTYKF